MPAAAVATLTPAISGMAGTSVGASGETEVDMGGAFIEKRLQDVDARAFGPGIHAKYSTLGAKSRIPGSMLAHRAGMTASLLRWRRHLAVGGLGRIGRLGGVRRLVHSLDLGGLAQLAHIFGLRLAR